MVEHDREFGTTGLWSLLQARRFSVYNREWLKATEGAGAGGSRAGSAGSAKAAPGGAAGGAASAYPQPLVQQQLQQQQMQQKMHQQQMQQQQAQQTVRPDAYVAEDDEDDAGAGAAAVGSPLHHMGRHGEAVAFDVSYLYQQQARGPAARPLISDGKNGLGAPYDYAEDVDDDEGGMGGVGSAPLDDVGEVDGEDEEDDEEDDGPDVGEDVRAMMASYMQQAPKAAVRGGPVHASSRLVPPKAQQQQQGVSSWNDD